MGWFGSWFGTGTGSLSFPAITNATTADAIRDRAIAVVKAIVPTVLPGYRFRESEDEGSGNFIDWAEDHPNDALRRFQIEFDGTDPTPAVSSWDHEERLATLVTTIAYPHTAKAGSRQALDRHKAMDRDKDLLKRAIGIDSRPNFTDPYPDAAWREGDCIRVEGNSCDYLILTNVYAYRRSRT